MIKVYEYSPWEDKFFGGYEREVTTYYLPVRNYTDLSDYLSLDLENLAIQEENTKESRTTLQVEDMYNEVIREVELLIQDLDSGESFHDDIWLYFGFFILIYVLIWCALPSFDINISDCVIDFKNDLSDYFKDAKTYKENMLKLKELLEISKKLIDENDEYKARFIKIYEKYANYLNSKKLEESYMKLVRKKADEI